MSMAHGEDEIGWQRDAAKDDGDGNCLQAGPEDNGKVGDEGDALGSRPSRSGEVTALMPVPQEAIYYKMDHTNRGEAIIFNHENFNIDSLQQRRGTNEDCDNLKKTLTALNFRVRTYKDLQYENIKNIIETTAKTDHTHSDCIVIAFLTHGDTGIIYAKDGAYKPENMFAYFTADRCKTLAGKPKIFLIQACQGDNLDQGVTLRTTETDGEVINSYKIPIQADFLIAYSTVKGYYSWRNTTNGSWFIQALCESIRRYVADYDLASILTFTSRMVAVNFESNVPGNISMHKQKQIPCMMSMLTRLIKFPVAANGNAGSDCDVSVDGENDKYKNLFKGIFNNNKGKAS